MLIVRWGVVEVSVLSMAGRMAVVTLVLMLAVGCAAGGSAGPEPAAGSGGPSVSAQPPSAPPLREALSKIISVRISDGRVDGVPARVEVDQGTPVRLEVTSDRADELHVHGYDETAQLAPGSPAAVAFVADLPGVFDVETHDSGLLLFQLVVRE